MRLTTRDLEEGQDVVSLVDCVDKDLRRAIEYTEGDSVFDSDKMSTIPRSNVQN